MTQKKFGANLKMSTSPKIPNFQNGGKSLCRHFHMLGQNSSAYNLYIIGKEVLLGLILS